MCTKNDNHMMYGSWNTEWNRQNFWSFWAIFCLFSPLTTRKIKILKLKKTPGDIILHFCTINDNHMMYGSWDMEYNRQTHLPPKNLKNQNFEKMKKRLETLSFYTCVPKIRITHYTVPEIWHVTDVIVIFHFGLFFALLPL